jgi:hypothetical protein
MSISGWFRRLFSPRVESPDEEATLREDYGAIPESGPEVERPDVPMAIPASGGTDPGARPGAPAVTEAGEPDEDQETPIDPAV